MGDVHHFGDDDAVDIARGDDERQIGDAIEARVNVAAIGARRNDVDGNVDERKDGQRADRNAIAVVAEEDRRADDREPDSSSRRTVA